LFCVIGILPNVYIFFGNTITKPPEEENPLPRKSAANNEETEKESAEETDAKSNEDLTNAKAEIDHLNTLLAAVLNYLSDDEVEVIDIDYLLTNTEGLQEWWDQYKERNRKKIEEEIKKSLGSLSIEELESIREKIKTKETP
jgi:hypothetical protein